MLSKLWDEYKKHEEGINYLIFGGLTTVISWGVCFALAYSIFDTTIARENFIVNFIGWVAGVAFAYTTNRKFVFKSKSENVFKELSSFVSSRIATLILDLVIMWLAVNIMSLPYAPVKIVSGILVIVCNYILSKIFVFKKEETTEVH